MEEIVCRRKIVDTNEKEKNANLPLPNHGDIP